MDYINLLFVLAQLLLQISQQTSGLVSDYKTCGDLGCESMMSRVQALRDYNAHDCRFLSFKKGDMILVYYKLSGKRNDLWAGSIGKQFGLFPKNTVRVDEVFVAEKNEIQMPTQNYDFFCMDESGSVVEIEIDDLEFNMSDNDDPKSADNIANVEDTEESQSEIHEEFSGNDKLNLEKDRSSSGTSTQFGDGKQIPEDGSDDQESFKSRKLALDMDENKLEGQNQDLGWIGDELTNVFGFGTKDLNANLPEDETEDGKNSPTNTKSSSWLGSISDVLSFGSRGDTQASSKSVNTFTQDEENAEPHQFYDSKHDKTMPNGGDVPIQNVENEDDTNIKNEKSSVKDDEGWYGSVYNRITSLYGDVSDKVDARNEGASESLSERDSQNQQSSENAEGKDTDLGGMGILVDHLSTVFGGLKSQFGSDASDKEAQSNEDATDQKVAGKKDFDEHQNDKDEKSCNDEEFSVNSITTDVIRQSQAVSDQELTPLSSSVCDDSVIQDQINNVITEEKSLDLPEHRQTENLSDDRTDADVNGEYFSRKDKRKDEVIVDVDDVRLNKSLYSDGVLNTENVKFDPKLGHVSLPETNKLDNKGDNTTSEIITDQTESPKVETEESKKDDMTDDDGVVTSNQLASHSEKTLVSDGANTNIALNAENIQSDPKSGHAGLPDPNIFNDKGADIKLTSFTVKTESSKQAEVAEMENKMDKVTNVRPKSGQVGLPDPNEFDSKSDSVTLGINTDESESSKQAEVAKPDLVTEHLFVGDISAETDKIHLSENKTVEVKNKDGKVGDTREVVVAEYKVSVVTTAESDEHYSKVSDGSEGAKIQLEARADEFSRYPDHHVSITDEQSLQSDRDLSPVETPDVSDKEQKGLDGSVKKGSEATEVLSELDEVKGNHESTGIEQAELGSEKMEVDFIQEEEEIFNSVYSSENTAEVDVESTQLQETKSDSGSDQFESERIATGKTAEDIKSQKTEKKVPLTGNTVDKALKSSEGGEHSDIERSITKYDNKEDTWLDVSSESTEDVMSAENALIYDASLSESQNMSECNTSIHNANEDYESHNDADDSEMEMETSKSYTTVKDTKYEGSILDLDVDTNSEQVSKEQVKDNMEKRNEISNDIPSHTVVKHDFPAEESQKSASGKYPNLENHINQENIRGLLEFFDGHQLSWLDYNLGKSKKQISQNNEDLITLRDFQQTLEYNVEKVSKSQEFTSVDKAHLHLLLQRVDNLLSTIKEKFSPVMADGSIDKGPDTNPKRCVNEDCGKLLENTSGSEKVNGKEHKKRQNSSILKNHHLPSDKQEIRDEANKNPRAEDGKTGSNLFVEPDNSQYAAVLSQYAALVSKITLDALAHAQQMCAHLSNLMLQVVSFLPEDIRPGPDLYGVPWEAALFTAGIGLVIMLLFSCRFIQSIKSRLYARKEMRMGQKVAELLEEKSKLLETLSECKQKSAKLESELQNGVCSANAAERKKLEAMSKDLKKSNAKMKDKVESLQEELDNQKKYRQEQEEQLAELEETLRKLEEETKERNSLIEQEKTTLKIYEMNIERLQKNLEAAKVENTVLEESTAQLAQKMDEWKERVKKLEEEKRACESSNASLLENCNSKNERIKSLTDCLVKMRVWEDDEDGGKNEEDSVEGGSVAAASENRHSTDIDLKEKVQKLINAVKMSAELKAMEEDKDRAFTKLADEIKAKEQLQEGIKQIQQEKETLESEISTYTEEIQKLQNKLQIMSEMYQEKEVKLHRMINVEERERSQKEERLNKAGRKINVVAEELNTYRQRARDMEEELEKTNESYRKQISAFEKKANDNWLAARAAERDLAEVKRENAALRERLTNAQFKVEMMEKNMYTRDSSAKPAFRGERSPFGPSPLSRPASETRAFLSPPTLMDGPPRLSPQFPPGPGARVSRSVMEPPGGVVESERSSAAHSDSGSVSPSWERERRIPAGPMPPDPALMYRRTPPGPFPLGPLPPRPPAPPDAYFRENAEIPVLGNSPGAGENEGREGAYPGDIGAPLPDAERSMLPPAGPHAMPLPPMMDPRDPRFPLRPPFGPPDFFPPRGPGLPPLGLRGPLPPPGMFPRVPLVPPHMGFPPLRPPLPPPDSFLPGPLPRPSPPGSEQPPHPHHQQQQQPSDSQQQPPPAPHDAI